MLKLSRIKKLIRVFVIAQILLAISSMLFLRVDAEENLNSGYAPVESLEIISADFAFDPYSKENYDPVIKVKVFNDSNFLIHRVLLNVDLKADNGKFHIFSDRFVQYISGGIKPYQTQVFMIYPGRSSFWKMRNIPYDTQIEVKVDEVFIPNKNSPWQHEFEFNIPSRVDYLD